MKNKSNKALPQENKKMILLLACGMLLFMSGSMVWLSGAKDNIVIGFFITSLIVSFYTIVFIEKEYK